MCFTSRLLRTRLRHKGHEGLATKGPSFIVRQLKFSRRPRRRPIVRRYEITVASCAGSIRVAAFSSTTTHRATMKSIRWPVIAILVVHENGVLGTDLGNAERVPWWLDAPGRRRHRRCHGRQGSSRRPARSVKVRQFVSVNVGGKPVLPRQLAAGYQPSFPGGPGGTRCSVVSWH